MKSTNTTSSKQAYKLTASHTLVIAVFTQPYLLYVLADFYRILTNDTTTVVVDRSLTAVLSTISTVALLVAIVALSMYLFSRNNK